MIRLLMLLFNLPGRGTYWRAFSMAQELAAEGYDVTLMVTSPRRRRGFSVHQIGNVRQVEAPDLLPGSLRSGWDGWATLARIAWLRGRSFDLVHAFESRPVVILPALYLQRVHGVPLILDWCDWFGRGGSVEERSERWVRMLLRPAETYFEETFRSRADGTTVINTFLHKKALDLGVRPDRILLLPNGSNVREIRPGDQTEARRRLGLPEEARLVAYTGSIFKRDAQLMAQAFDLVHAARPETRLLMIGYCNQPLEEWVAAPEAVIRSGPIDYGALGDYLTASDLGWLPLCDSGANRGRCPLKLNDFMAAGRAVVATDVGDLGDFVRRESIGYVAPDEPGPLAGAVLALLQDDTGREQLAQNARQVAETKVAWPLLAAQLRDFYQDIRAHTRSRITHQ